MKNLKRMAAAGLIIGLIALPATASAIASSVTLGTAGSYGVLAGQSVTNTGTSVISGDLGVSPGTAITGFPPGVVLGTQHSADAAALQAQVDLVTAYNGAAAQATDAAISGDIGGLTLVPGVYTASGSIGLTGTLTLDAQGDPNAVWVFQVGSTLTTASNGTVDLINDAQACNVYWQVGSSATLGTNTAFVGTILALTSITANTEAAIDGRLLARNGSVTLDTNLITQSTCTIFLPPTPAPTLAPTIAPTLAPTDSPAPTLAPTIAPTLAPTDSPAPTLAPTIAPTAAPTDAPIVTQAPTVAPIVTAAPLGSANTADAAAVSAVPAVVITPAPTDAPVAVVSEAPESAPTINGPRIVIEEGTPDVTLPPTDMSPLGGNDGRAQNFGGVLVLIGGLLVLAAAVIVRRQPARR